MVIANLGISYLGMTSNLKNYRDPCSFEGKSILNRTGNFTVYLLLSGIVPREKTGESLGTSPAAALFETS